jgi:hypothetical protein
MATAKHRATDVIRRRMTLARKYEELDAISRGTRQAGI